MVGCLAAVASGGGGKGCRSGALSGAVGALGTPFINTGSVLGNAAAHGLIGGLASVAGGGKFENGAVTAAFGYLFNQAALLTKRDSTGGHSALFIPNDGEPVLYDPAGHYTGAGDPGDGTIGGSWTGDSASVEAYKKFYKDLGYDVDVTWLNTTKADEAAMAKWIEERSSGGNPFYCAQNVSECLQQAPSTKGLDS